MRREKIAIFLGLGSVLVGASLWTTACNTGPIRDEAMRASRNAQSFTAADEDYFRDMDGGGADRPALAAAEVRGRNTWNVWTGGNDKFWDTISRQSVGTLDLLKTISSYDPASDPNAPKDPIKLKELKDKYRFSRSNRWGFLGVINEPCFDKPTGPDSNRHGLWLDKRRTGASASPTLLKTSKNIRGSGSGLGARICPSDPRTVMPLAYSGSGYSQILISTRPLPRTGTR